jgi:hypothetical protein
MPTDRLAVVTCHFNPCGYQRPRENYARFRQALSGARLFTIEVSFDGRFHLPADWQLAATEDHVLWQKEALLNAVIAKLPAEFDRVAWIDADLLFLNPQWAAETVALLDQFPVVQLFETCHYTTAAGTLGDRWPSLLRKRRERLPGHGAPGGAWAARRDLLARHGLYAGNIVGGGDQVFVDGLFGVWRSPSTRTYPRRMIVDVQRWQRGVWADVRGQVGCVSGDVIHLYHGTRDNRRYAARTALLRDADYDPTHDIRVGEAGLLEWSSEKPALHAAVREYFQGRREDE